MTSAPAPTTRWLDRGTGRIAFDVTGDGPLLVCVPGMGDLRAAYRLVVEPLVAAGHRVATLDLRGHGDSDTTFDSFDDVALAGDVAALVTELGGPAVLLGSSMGAGAVTLVAAEHPELVSGLVLLGPFLRNPPANPVLTGVFRLALQPLWIRQVWKAYLPRLYAGDRPADFADYASRVLDALKLPGHARAFARTAATTHQPVEARLSDVRAPSVVVMGTLDPDFGDPRAEAEWIADRIGSRVVMVERAGHYPQSQRPDVTVAATLELLGRVARA